MYVDIDSIFVRGEIEVQVTPEVWWADLGGAHTQLTGQSLDGSHHLSQGSENRSEKGNIFEEILQLSKHVFLLIF